MPTISRATNLRLVALVLAVCGVVCSLGFWALTFPSAKWALLPRFLRTDALPYLLLAVAIAFSRTRGAAAICLVASAFVLAFGIYTYVDLVRFSWRNGWINDITLLTYPVKWLFTMLAGLAAGLDLMFRYEARIH
jgi:hypothetical protein